MHWDRKLLITWVKKQHGAVLDPHRLCFSRDIPHDEADVKVVLRDTGCLHLCGHSPKDMFRHIEEQ